MCDLLVSSKAQKIFAFILALIGLILVVINLNALMNRSSDIQGFQILPSFVNRIENISPMTPINTFNKINNYNDTTINLPKIYIIQVDTR